MAKPKLTLAQQMEPKAHFTKMLLGWAATEKDGVAYLKDVRRFNLTEARKWRPRWVRGERYSREFFTGHVSAAKSAKRALRVMEC